MELFSAEFFSALIAIVVIDLVLAGDNAIVIALAARNLSPQLRKRAVVWGTIGAIAVRTAMTMIVVWLLKIPGLMLLGGVLLMWIAYKLIIDKQDGEAHQADPASNFWAAMKTIIVADALMGLDNVLAVAGAAQGSFLLVVLGLIISIPIVIYGSQLILKYVERFPAIVYIGAGVLAWTSVKMIVGEPMLKEFVAQNPQLVLSTYVAVIGGVLSVGLWMNRRVARAGTVPSPVAAMERSFASVATALGADDDKGGAIMCKVLIPVDGSPNALNAVQHVSSQCLSEGMQEVHLLNVHTPFLRPRFTNKSTRTSFHRAAAQRALEPAKALLEKFNIPFSTHVEVGDRAELISQVAQRLGVDQIVIGISRKNSVTRAIENSVTTRVVELAQVPVKVVAGQTISRYERIGIPAGVSALLAWLFAVAE